MAISQKRWVVALALCATKASFRAIPAESPNPCLSVQGFNAEWQRPGDFGAYVRNEVPKWGEVVKNANVKVRCAA